MATPTTFAALLLTIISRLSASNHESGACLPNWVYDLNNLAPNLDCSPHFFKWEIDRMLCECTYTEDLIDMAMEYEEKVLGSIDVYGVTSIAVANYGEDYVSKRFPCVWLDEGVFKDMTMFKLFLTAYRNLSDTDCEKWLAHNYTRHQSNDYVSPITIQKQRIAKEQKILDEWIDM